MVCSVCGGVFDPIRNPYGMFTPTVGIPPTFYLCKDCVPYVKKTVFEMKMRRD